MLTMIQASQVQQVNDVKVAELAAKIAENKKAEGTKAHTLDRVDTFVNTAERFEDHILGGIQSVKNNIHIINDDKVVTDYTNPLKSMKSSAINKAVTSVVRNGYKVIRKQITLAQAEGNIVGDVSAAAINGGVSALVSDGVVWVMAKAGASSFPVMLGGMIAGQVAHSVSSKVLKKTGVQTFITAKTTELLEKIGDKK